MNAQTVKIWFLQIKGSRAARSAVELDKEVISIEPQMALDSASFSRRITVTRDPKTSEKKYNSLAFAYLKVYYLHRK